MNNALEELHLCNNNFGNANLRDLVEGVLNRNKRLRSLDLAGNEIGPKGCTSLANILQNQDSNLEELYLDRNSIDDESVGILACSLAKNKKLGWLWLEGNNAITDVGLSMLL